MLQNGAEIHKRRFKNYVEIWCENGEAQGAEPASKYPSQGVQGGMGGGGGLFIINY